MEINITSLISHTIEHYHILEQLGEGGMAVVYKAFDTRLERNVAIKVIRTDQFGKDALQRVLQRFDREARSLARLSHPNIVRVLEYGNERGIPFIVMDYVPGGTLKKHMGKPIPWQDAARFLVPVARALAYAHQHGVIHRDIKPSNILITQSGAPMLSDFGVAKILGVEETHTLTGTGVGVGTPEYMAPEQGIGGEIDVRADVYALGIVFYEMITGRKPFTATTPMAVIIKHVNDPLPSPTQFVPNLPERVEQVLIKALAKKPEDRFATMDAFAQALEFLLNTAGDTSATVIDTPTGERTFDALAATETADPVPGPHKGQRKLSLKWLPAILVGACLCIVAATGTGYAAYKLLASPTPTVQNGPSLTPSLPASGVTAITWTPTVSIGTDTPTPTTTSSPTSPPSNGGTSVSSGDGMIMVYVPAGEFIMGANSSDPNAAANEKPVHSVYLDGYWIDQTEVTNAMFAAFVSATGYITDAERYGTGTTIDFSNSSAPWVPDAVGVYWEYPHSQTESIAGMDLRPVVQVSWNDAVAYCQWAGRRLPTEAEWEKAARGTDGNSYPWGNATPDANLLNFDRNIGHLTNVGSYPAGASPYGALDMLGNAYEWVTDWYDPNYYASSPSSNPSGPSSGGAHVIRGGAWNYGLNWTRTTSRSQLTPDSRVETLGFRCAASATP